ncbi:MAG TPA: VOC family protein, partial [Dongiaceae bacterium]|nr:VOC family protein [Dongiaceae bacterium]
MKVKRIVANIATDDVAKAKRFYGDILGLDILMDHGWLVAYGSAEKMTVQVGIATQGGSDTPVPDLSIEVDDVEEALARVKKAKIRIDYGPADEPWNVRRFFVRDPFGKLVNIL